MQKKFNILHISDLHLRNFEQGRETKSGYKLESEKLTIDYELALIKFIDCIKNINTKTKIDCVLITGDIYNFADKNINTKNIDLLIKTIKSISKNILIAFGNHELRLNYSKHNNQLEFKTTQSGELDDFEDLIGYKLNAPYNFEKIKSQINQIINPDKLDYSKIKKLENLLFITPLDQFEISPVYRLKNHKLKTFGIYYNANMHPNIIFVVINSAWINFSSEQSKNKLIAGHKIINEIDNELKLKYNKKDDKLVITLIHNDYNWFDYTERHKQLNQNNSTIEIINNFSDFILCGHEHCEVPPAFIDFNSCIFKVGGLLADFNLSFSLLKLNFMSSLLERNCYIWDNSNCSWEFSDKYHLNCELFSGRSKNKLKHPVRDINELFLLTKEGVNNSFKPAVTLPYFGQVVNIQIPI